MEKLMGQLKRSEKARTDTEQKMLVLKEELSGLQETSTKSANTVKELSLQLRDYQEKLQATDQMLAEVKVCFVVSSYSQTNIEGPLQLIITVYCIVFDGEVYTIASFKCKT